MLINNKFNVLNQHNMHSCYRFDIEHLTIYFSKFTLKLDYDKLKHILFNDFGVHGADRQTDKKSK